MRRTGIDWLNDAYAAIRHALGVVLGRLGTVQHCRGIAALARPAQVHLHRAIERQVYVDGMRLAHAIRAHMRTETSLLVVLVNWRGAELVASGMAGGGMDAESERVGEAQDAKTQRRGHCGAGSGGPRRPISRGTISRLALAHSGSRRSTRPSATQSPSHR